MEAILNRRDLDTDTYHQTRVAAPFCRIPAAPQVQNLFCSCWSVSVTLRSLTVTGDAWTGPVDLRDALRSPQKRPDGPPRWTYPNPHRKALSVALGRLSRVSGSRPSLTAPANPVPASPAVPFRRRPIGRRTRRGQAAPEAAAGLLFPAMTVGHRIGPLARRASRDARWAPARPSPRLHMNMNMNPRRSRNVTAIRPPNRPGLVHGIGPSGPP